MKIEPVSITIERLAKDFKDDQEGGVRGFSSKLDIRPPYQREFVYNDKQREAVIDTVIKGYPLNVMYWAVRNDGTFEIIDGQQRTISICQYVNGDFSFKNLYFHNLQEDQKRNIYDYELTVYQCSGSDSEKLEWFKTINIAGAKLFDQELRNAVYSGPWVSDAKRYFSRTNCPAKGVGQNYLTGSTIRQDYLETVIDWISNGNIEDYMGKHQADSDASVEWEYFQKVITWVQSNFIVYRSEMMKGLPWGTWFNKYKDQKIDPKALEIQIANLVEDEEIDSKRGIYAYILTNDEKYLNLRLFDDKQKREAYERQKGVCVICGEQFEFDEMAGDHIIPWSKGGKTEGKNCQMLCIKDNSSKGAR